MLRRSSWGTLGVVIALGLGTTVALGQGGDNETPEGTAPQSVTVPAAEQAACPAVKATDAPPIGAICFDIPDAEIGALDPALQRTAAIQSLCAGAAAASLAATNPICEQNR